MTSLLEKFESVEVPTQALLTDADIAYCNQTEAEYRKAIQQLDLCLTALQGLYEQQKSLNLTPNKLSEWTKHYAYNARTEIDNIVGLKCSLIKIYVENIIDYFNSTYTLKLNGFIPKKSTSGNVNLEIPWREIADWVLSQTNGDLAGATFATLTKNLHNEFGRRSSVVLKGNTIHFNSCLQLVSNCSIWGARLAYSDSSYVRLTDRLLSYFENQTLGIKVIGEYYQQNGREVEKFPLTVEMNTLKKVKAIKLYKNERVDFIFPTEALANEFYFLFQLHTIKTNI